MHYGRRKEKTECADRQRKEDSEGISLYLAEKTELLPFFPTLSSEPKEAEKQEKRERKKPHIIEERDARGRPYIVNKKTRFQKQEKTWKYLC